MLCGGVTVGVGRRWLRCVGEAGGGPGLRHNLIWCVCVCVPSPSSIVDPQPLLMPSCPSYGLYSPWWSAPSQPHHPCAAAPPQSSTPMSSLGIIFFRLLSGTMVASFENNVCCWELRDVNSCLGCFCSLYWFIIQQQK